MDGNAFWSVRMPASLGGEAPVDGGDWRATLKPESREMIADEIMESIKRYLLFSGQEGLQELKKIAELIEEKSYNSAANQSDYWCEISSKMLTIDSKSQNSVPNSLTPNSAGTDYKPPDSGVLTASPNLLPQGQSLLVPLPDNQPEAQQQLSENMESTMTSTGVQTPTSLQTCLPPASGTNQTPINVIGQNANNMSYIAPNPVGSTLMAQGVPSNMFGNAQQQLIELQKQLVQLQQQLLIQLQCQQQLQPQQNVMNMTQLQPATLPGMQNSSGSIIGAPVSSLPQNQLSSVQQSITMEQQQQQQKRQFGQQTDHQNTLQHPLTVQLNNHSGMHQQQMVPQSNFSGLLQEIPQHQLLGTQSGNSSILSNLSGNHQQQLVPPSNFSGIRQLIPQQQGPATQPGNSIMQSNLSGNHQQQLVPQSLQQQMQQQRLRQLYGTQSGNSRMQSNLSGKDQQHSVPQSYFSGVFQQQSLGTMSGISSMQSNLSASLDSTAQTGHANGGDWQHEVYQKIQTMKEMYLPELDEMYQKLDTQLEQHCDSPVLKAKLERMISFLQVSKNSVLTSYKEWINSYEKEMITLLNVHRPSKRMRQLPSPHMQIDDAIETKPDISTL